MSWLRDWKCMPEAKFLVKFVQSYRDTFFSNMWSVIKNSIFWWGWSKGKVQTFGLSGRQPPIPSLSGTSWFPIRKTLRRVLGLLIVMILKRVIDSVFFQSNKFTACKVKDEKEVANCLMAFTLLKIIHPFQGKKHLRT